MKKRVVRFIGIVYFIIGAVLFFNSFGITGFVIGGEVTRNIGSYIAIAFIFSGITLLIISRDWNKYRVSLVVREYESGALNPVQAVLKINEQLYPSGLTITGIEYHGNNPLHETIRTKDEFIPVRFRDSEKAKDFAIACYEMAVINDRKNDRNCELHISKEASSKHHKEGLQKLIKKFEDKYHQDLELAVQR